jgi:cytoskeleton protein RodZ
VFEIGNSLREARLRQSLDLADVERATKIRPKYLRALEDEQFEVLPAQTYVKGFLSTYAEFLGLDGQLYVDEYNSRYVTREAELPFQPRRSSAGRRRSRRVESTIVLATLVGIAIVFGLVIAAWNSGDNPGTNNQPQLADPGLRQPAESVLVVRGTRGASRMEIRRGSQEGKVVWSGTVEKGRQHGFTLKSRLWLYLGRPRSIDLVVSGRPQPAPARLLYVDANGVRRAPAVR